jgi:hypothetical protein
MSNFDAPWKEALELYLRPLLALLFPKVEQDVDWSQGYESLEQEFRPLLPEGETGLRLADKLLRVHTLSGDERVLAVEAQAQHRPHFTRRVYVYHYRGDDRFGVPPEALVILADGDPNWRPTTYEVQLKYTRLTFEFEPAKLLDWAGRKDELRQHENPMALFVLAHLEAQRTHNDDAERARVKLDLLVQLDQRTLDEDDLRHWHRFLGWLLDLPADLDDQVFAQARAMKQGDEPMQPIGYAEQREFRGLQSGKIAGRLEGLETALDIKFQEAGLALMPELRKIDDPDRLAAILQAVRKAASLDEVRALLAPTS